MTYSKHFQESVHTVMYVSLILDLSPPVTCTLVPGQWVLIKNVCFRARGGGAPAEYGGFHAQKKLTKLFL